MRYFLSVTYAYEDDHSRANQNRWKSCFTVRFIRSSRWFNLRKNYQWNIYRYWFYTLINFYTGLVVSCWQGDNDIHTHFFYKKPLYNNKDIIIYYNIIIIIRIKILQKQECSKNHLEANSSFVYLRIIAKVISMCYFVYLSLGKSFTK